MAEEKKYKTGKAKKTLSVDVLKYVSKYYIEANRAKKREASQSVTISASTP
jgi:hypothetical protein